MAAPLRPCSRWFFNRTELQSSDTPLRSEKGQVRGRATTERSGPSADQIPGPKSGLPSPSTPLGAVSSALSLRATPSLPSALLFFPRVEPPPPALSSSAWAESEGTPVDGRPHDSAGKVTGWKDRLLSHAQQLFLTRLHLSFANKNALDFW